MSIHEAPANVLNTYHWRAHDVDNCVAKGLKSRGYKPGWLVLDPACGLNSEHSVRKLQEWMREAVDG